ncbi:hypothetical protein [Cohnella zeiphila]|uniref:Uncharacterized protein n=1 Tax=Cohnella zeiphila TaxID=2761120 RepID=A0A7X0VXF7_9BACL|nr:hypothetical protein [Cohnella zeiphila]MBB6733971.1 hypothetical protein [Cohnella zeiphila]
MIVGLLRRCRGKAVVLKLVSAEEVGGVVVKVNKGIVVLRTLLGTKMFIPVPKIVAVITG